MTPTPNTYYTTRDGRKAYVAAVLPDDVETYYPVVGWLTDRQGGKQTASWTPTGAYHCKSERAGDLLEEWQEPVKLSGWLNLHTDGSGMAHRTLEEAQNDRYEGDCCTTIRIEYEQGQSEGKWFREPE